MNPIPVEAAAVTSGTEQTAAIVSSSEANDQVVDSLYQILLHRERETGSSSTWDLLLDNGTDTITDVAIGILASDEYLQDALAGRV